MAEGLVATHLLPGHLGSTREGQARARHLGMECRHTAMETSMRVSSIRAGAQAVVYTTSTRAVDMKVIGLMGNMMAMVLRPGHEEVDIEVNIGRGCGRAMVSTVSTQGMYTPVNGQMAKAMG